MAMKGHVDLADYIDWTAVECLNENPSHTVQNALKEGYRDDESLFLESDTDEQLIIHVAFNQAVKVSSLVITGPTDGCGPSKVKLFVNRPTVGFSEAMDESGTQEVALSDKELQGEPLQLRFAKFQSVNTLSVFIDGNQGDEETTKVFKIAITGTTSDLMKFDVADIKKVGEPQE